jgi:exodeoxyribonuclease-1
MQFAGIRTDLELKPIGEPINLLVRLTDEVLPSPEAILITGLTPQQSVREGITEAELAKRLTAEVFTPGTIATGFNSVRFDDVFMRYLFYRNFYDPYEWAWSEGRSRWDLLDVMRMARALRPDGLEWPVDEDGLPVNKLAMLSAANHLVHTKAHDALSDVEALIAVAAHLRQAQPKFFDYLLALRSKHEVAKVVSLAQPQPFVYTSGRFPKQWHHTSIAYPIGAGAHNAVQVYDLRHDPAPYLAMPFEQLTAARFPSKQLRETPEFKPFPAKLLAPGNCPAVAPLATLSPEAEARIALTKATAATHLEALLAGDLIAKLREALEPRDFEPDADVDGRLYEGFMGAGDKAECAHVRGASGAALASLSPRFRDPRLPELYLRYKARNYPDSLTAAERTDWETYRAQRLAADWPAFAATMERVGATATATQMSLLTDLTMWAQSILPAA